MIMKDSFDEQCTTYSQMNLIVNSRLYFRRLATWTRAYFISRFAGIGSEEDLFGRLYLESFDFGNLLRLFFGREYSEQYAQLMNNSSILMRELLSAQFAGNTEEVRQNVDRLYDNADQRVEFLASINPHFDEAEGRNILYAFTRETLEMANSFITGDYSQDIERYNRLTELTNRMGDFFAEALHAYITNGTPPAVSLLPEDQICITAQQMNLIYSIRMFWFELALWTRAYMLSRYAGLGNTEEVYARLRQVPDDYVANLRQFFGETLGAEALERQLSTYLDLIDDLITAQMEGNIDEINQITRLLYENADERAAAVTSINPAWSEEEWKVRLYDNLRYTINQSETFLTRDYMNNLDIFSTLLDLAESTSGYFAQGLFNYLVARQQT